MAKNIGKSKGNPWIYSN